MPETALEQTSYRFISYGVRMEIAGDTDLVTEAATVAARSLLGHIRPMRGSKVDHRFELARTGPRSFHMTLDGEQVATARSRMKYFKFLDSMIRVTVGEYAVDRVFLHAGVVAWNGKGILLPGDPYQGKSTLVTELVQNGAVYYSDDYAVLDAEGRVHPYARDIGRRTERHRPYDITPESIGAEVGVEPVEISAVILTRYSEGATWRPKRLSAGGGVLAMLPYALSLRHKPDFTLKVLNNIASRAIIASSPRGTADKMARTLLKFVDKHGI